MNNMIRPPFFLPALYCVTKFRFMNLLLQVKIQKMRSNLEEKLMRRMAVVHRKAEEWRAAAQVEHSHHLIKASKQSQKMRNQDAVFQENSPCGCFRYKH